MGLDLVVGDDAGGGRVRKPGKESLQRGGQAEPLGEKVEHHQRNTGREQRPAESDQATRSNRAYGRGREEQVPQHIGHGYAEHDREADTDLPFARNASRQAPAGPCAAHDSGNTEDKQPEELRKPFKGAEPPKETREETSMKKDELKDFIKKELSQGKDREEITKNLERIGYNIENINQIFDEELHNALPKEYEQQIRKYVAYYLDKGNTPEEIREKLKAQGWSDNVIDKFLVR